MLGITKEYQRNLIISYDRHDRQTPHKNTPRISVMTILTRLKNLCLGLTNNLRIFGRNIVKQTTYPNILLRCEHKYYKFTIEVTPIILSLIPLNKSPCKGLV